MSQFLFLKALKDGEYYERICIKVSMLACQPFYQSLMLTGRCSSYIQMVSLLVRLEIAFEENITSFIRPKCESLSCEQNMTYYPFFEGQSGIKLKRIII